MFRWTRPAAVQNIKTKIGENAKDKEKEKERIRKRTRIGVTIRMGKRMRIARTIAIYGGCGFVVRQLFSLCV